MASEEDTVVLGLDMIIVAIACVHRLCITNTTATMPSIRDQGVTQTQVSNTTLRIVCILVKCRLRPTKQRRRQNTENDDIAFYPMARLRLEVRLALNIVQPPFFIYGFFCRLLLLFRSSATSCLYYSIQTTTAIPTQTVLPCCLIVM